MSFKGNGVLIFSNFSSKMEKILYIPGLISFYAAYACDTFFRDNIIQNYEKKIEKSKMGEKPISSYRHQSWTTAAERGQFSVNDLHYFGSMSPERHLT